MADTVGEWLAKVRDADSSSENDAIRMQNLLRRVGFPKARVVLGIVYPEGEGTLDFPPMTIQGIAKKILQLGRIWE